MSQRKVDIQYVVDWTPAMACKCLAFDNLSSRTKFPMYPAMNGKLLNMATAKKCDVNKENATIVPGTVAQ